MSSIWKGGWHPEGKGGGKESWRGDFKGIDQIANKFGKGRDTGAGPSRQSSSSSSSNHPHLKSVTSRFGIGGSQDDDMGRSEHVARPLASLKDPSTFGPPPKHVDYYGPAAAGVPAGTQRAQQRAAEQQQEEEEEKAPPGPYQRDTTGLSTANLPKPPVRRINSASPVPPPPPRSNHASPAPPPRGAIAPPPPKIPPRLPARQNSHPDDYSPAPPPTYNEAASIAAPDPSALNRLGQAGVSVPGFDIGGNPSPPVPTRTKNPTPPGAPQAAQVNELQSRFAKMQFPSSSSTNGNNSNNGESTSQGTTWEQKRAAADTASKFHKDPTSVSFSDARSAAGTANNFRERHGETVKSGYQTAREMSSKYGQQAKDMNKKYGITDRAKGYATSAANYNRSAPSSSSTATVAAAKKPPPPPPPPKRRDLAGGGVDGQSSPDSGLLPPPVPLSSKPR